MLTAPSHCLWITASSLVYASVQSTVACTIHVPGDHATIQQAIDAAIDGCEIIVGPGVYNENIAIEFKAITVRSNAGADATTISAADAQKPVAVIHLTDGNGLVTIDGFTMTGGSGGVDLAFADALIENCIIHENPDGSGLDAFWSNLTVGDCTIRLNGGSNVIGGGIRTSLSWLTMHDSTIADNRGSLGGGLSLSETFVDVQGCEMTNNEGDDGGAIYIGFSDVAISDTTFTKNTALNEGGAIRLADALGVALRLDNCVVRFNQAASGGGIWIGSEAQANITGSHFCENAPDHIAGDWTDDGGNDFSATCLVGDLSGDGVVGVPDLLILLGDWGPCPRSGDCPADLNGDGAVNVSDLLILLANWS